MGCSCLLLVAVLAAVVPLSTQRAPYVGICAAMKTTSDDACVFPFEYKGILYTSCTTVNNRDTLWCSTDPIYDGHWGNCNLTTCTSGAGLGAKTPPPCLNAKTISGTDCAMPFTYKGITYSACTTVDNGDNMWCSLDRVYKGRYDLCDARTCPPTCGTAKTTSGAPCAIPFSYRGVTYNACTTENNGGNLWCSLDHVYNGRYGTCDLNTCPPECGSVKTTSGHQCVIPFEYKGLTYNACTNVDNGDKLWCSLNVTYNGQWGNVDMNTCPGGYRTVSSGQTTNTGAACAIPFVYKSRTYTGCTTVNNGDTLWCSLDREYDGNWGNCDINTCPMASGMARTNSGDLCAIPFTYEGRTYSGCTTVKNDGVPWCSLDATYRGNWGNCDSSNWPSAYGTAKTTSGAACAIPFEYKDRLYSACTTVDNDDKLWCSTDTIYKGNWGDCRNAAICPKSCLAAMTTRGERCALPFTYKGHTYSTCTTVSNDNTPWCSLDNVYDGRYGTCDLSTCNGGGGLRTDNCVSVRTTTGELCALPFVYKGATYTQCTTINNNGVPWCSTEYMYNGNYGACDFDTCVPADGSPINPNPNNPIYPNNPNNPNNPIYPNNPNNPMYPNNPNYPNNPGMVPGGEGTYTTCQHPRTTSGLYCVIPFNYKGYLYPSCTTLDNGDEPWCSLDATYKGNWGKCDLSTCNPVRTNCAGGGVVRTVTGEFCHFPFTYNGETYYSCTEVKNGDTPWCALDATYEKNRWGNCDMTSCISSNIPGIVPGLPNPGGNERNCRMRTTSGEDCVFPFTYNGQTFYECTTVGQDSLWCATTSTYSPNRWGNCAVTKTTTGQTCVFPFEYRGGRYDHCIMEYATFAWCSTYPNMEVASEHWGQCDGCHM